MYKRNPYIEVINCTIFIVVNIILKNSIIEFILLYILLKTLKLKKRILSIILLLLGLINILFSNLTIYINLLNVILYLYILISKYNKKDILNIYIYLFGTNPQKLWIKSLYFKDYYKRNYEQIKYITKELGYENKFILNYYNIKKSYLKTKNDLEELIILFEKRQFFNKYKTIDIIDIDKNDIKTLLSYLLLLILTIIFWRSKYALFI